MSKIKAKRKMLKRIRIYIYIDEIATQFPTGKIEFLHIWMWQNIDRKIISFIAYIGEYFRYFSEDVASTTAVQFLLYTFAWSEIVVYKKQLLLSSFYKNIPGAMFCKTILCILCMCFVECVECFHFSLFIECMEMFHIILIYELQFSDYKRLIYSLLLFEYIRNCTEGNKLQIQYRE